MRRPVIATMSGVSVAVLGLSLHASGRTLPVVVGAAPAGLVETQGASPVDSAPIAPNNPGPTSTATAPPSPSSPRTPTPKTARASTATYRSTTAPARTSGAPRTSTTAGRTAPSPAARPTATPPVSTVVVNGSRVDTQYGPVQVQITLRGGHIIKADAIDYPQSSGRDQEINSQAIPQLNQETVQANSAQIDTVSGATYTSGGYRQSLQSALDAAHKAGAR